MFIKINTMETTIQKHLVQDLQRTAELLKRLLGQKNRIWFETTTITDEQVLLQKPQGKILKMFLDKDSVVIANQFVGHTHPQCIFIQDRGFVLYAIVILIKDTFIVDDNRDRKSVV